MVNQKDIAPGVGLGEWDPSKPPGKDNPIKHVEPTEAQKELLEECRLAVLDSLAELGITWDKDKSGELKMNVPYQLQRLSKKELFELAMKGTTKNLDKDESKE